MPLPYPVEGQYTGSVNSGSYFSEQDTSLYYVSQSADLWFGVSDRDVIEFGVYSVDDFSLQSWKTLYTEKAFKTVTLSYIDDLNVAHAYSYNELINQFLLYKHESVLLNPTQDLLNSNVTDGTYEVSYNFIRQMAGSPQAPLTIKEISPSRTEVKLIPLGKPNNAYTAFCYKKFPIKDVAPVILTITQNCPYSQIYNVMAQMPQYQAGIEFLKFAYFLTDDGSVLQFLRNIYEDYIKYTFLSETQIAQGIDPTQIYRIQGIKSYFNNHLLSNYEEISDWDSLSEQFSDYVNLRLDKRFGQVSTSAEAGYQEARKFCYDFFFQYFYTDSVTLLKETHNNKYFGMMKNVLNFGDNNYYRVTNINYLDERLTDTEALTLLLKLSTPLSTDVAPKTACWVSNMGMTPFTFTTVLQNPVKYKTIRISPPNFGSPAGFISKENINTLYSSDDLAMPEDQTQNQIDVNKQIAELNTDYSAFSNFVVFSSAETRLSLFKTKMVEYAQLSASLVELNRRYQNSLTTSYSYPYYSAENARLKDEVNVIFNSFDGYESYLYNTGMYEYSVVSGSFVNSEYVTNQDLSASSYDRNNSDYLVANTPQYILDDTENNGDYLTFLQMIGHHFDNIYTYIAAMPIERQVRNEISSSIPTSTLKEMLYSFGWNVDDIIGGLDIDEVYLNSLDSASYDVMSAEKRLQTIWNRILITLPGIFKTKGTEECVNYLMACYGLPTSLITVREYGGTDFSDNTKPTFRLDEKFYMLNFSGSTRLEGPIPHTVQSVEFKFSIDSNVSYPAYGYIPMFRMTPYPYTDSSNDAWNVGVVRTAGPSMGHVEFRLLSGSTGTRLTSSTMPIFNGDIFTVMVRRSDQFGEFEYTIDEDAIPLKYELIIQRNEDGRKIFFCSSSAYLYNQDNLVFSQFGRFTLGTSGFYGTIDKLSIWDIPLPDSDFEEHVNDLNSYGYSGSAAYSNLWVRLDWDYPQSMYYNLSGSSVVWVDNRSPYYAIPNYYTDPQNLSSSIDPTLYSASVNIFATRWQNGYPSGSMEIRAYDWPPITDHNWSASWNGCVWVSSSIYPYSFTEYTYQQDIDASKYGPNRYKNKKIRDITYDIEARFDPFDRSTSEPSPTTSGEGNQLGFFIDPQDAKNKDIVRYVGRNGVMDLIGDPADLYSDRYPLLVNKNREYNSHGNKRTYFTEMLTVYKFYFDKSIFSAIKNVMPARANAYTGVVIEPTILERPKYQNRPISSSVIENTDDSATIDDTYSFSETLLWSDFNTDWALLDTGSGAWPSTFSTYQEWVDYYTSPIQYQVIPSRLNRLPLSQQTQLQLTMSNSQPPNYQETINLSYVNLPTQVMPNNLPVMDICQVVPDFEDDVQFGYYPDFELLPRDWEVVNAPVGWPKDPIYGSVSHDKPNDTLTVGADQNDVVRTTDPTSAGYNSGSHPTLYYMVKVWEKNDYFAKTGEYIRTDNPNENPYQSASVWLYKYMVVSEPWMRQYVYWYNLQPQVAGNSDPSYTYSVGQYLHRVSTFKGTPDASVTFISASHTGSIAKTTFNIAPVTGSTRYFQIARGYPRNHYTHKMEKFSPTKYGKWISNISSSIFVKGKQLISTTVNGSGVADGTYPVQSFGTSNVNVVNATPVIQTVPSTTTGQVTPTTTPAVTVPNVEPVVPVLPTVACVPLVRQKYKNPSKKTKQVYNLTLGSRTGTVRLAWDAKGAKDRFVLNWNGVDVINTGCVKNVGATTFYKSQAWPTQATLTITSCEGSSAGEVQVDCPM